MASRIPELFRGLVDDAAVFPPGNSPLPDAVSGHRAHRDAWYADCVGPLLVPAGAAADLLGTLDAGHRPEPEPLAVAVIARPGTDRGVLADGVSVLAADPRVSVAGVELGWTPDWRRLGLPGELPLALEVPRGRTEQEAALADIRVSVAEGDAVVAKFRTGPAPTWPWPDEAELGTFLRGAAASPVPFKLTGGLHHVVRGTYEVGHAAEENHGFLNVLAATAAVLQGASKAEVEGLLAVRDAAALGQVADAWADDTAARVRGAFTSFGCCTVTDPIGELADLGLLTAP